jgi:hypothetical protein
MELRVKEFFGLLVILLACYTVSGTNDSSVLFVPEAGLPMNGVLSR